MSYIKSEDNVLVRQLKQLEKLREGYVSYLSRIINNTNELMGDYSNKEQLVNKDYFSLLPEENFDDEIKFFQTQEFCSVQMQTSIQRLVQR